MTGYLISGALGFFLCLCGIGWAAYALIQELFPK